MRFRSLAKKTGREVLRPPEQPLKPHSRRPISLTIHASFLRGLLIAPSSKRVVPSGSGGSWAREREGKGTSYPFTTLHPDPSSLLPDQLCSQIQPQAQTCRLCL